MKFSVTGQPVFFSATPVLQALSCTFTNGPTCCDPGFCPHGEAVLLMQNPSPYFKRRKDINKNSIFF